MKTKDSMILWILVSQECVFATFTILGSQNDVHSQLSHASVKSDDSWLQLEAPEDYTFPPVQRRRLLRKPRPRPVNPTPVLQQDGDSDDSSISRGGCRLLKFMARCKREKESWVCIEVTKEITQTYV